MIRTLITLLLMMTLAVACSRGPDRSEVPESPTQNPLLGLPSPTDSQFRDLADVLTTAFGDEPFLGFEQTAERFGWRALCSTDETLQNPLHGLIETEPEDNLPRLRLLYNQSGTHTPLVFIQQPATYALPDESGSVETRRVNGFDVRFWEEGDRAGASFKTGESVQGHDIFGTVYGRGFGLARIVAFVESLRFECSPREES